MSEGVRLDLTPAQNPPPIFVCREQTSVLQRGPAEIASLAMDELNDIAWRLASSRSVSEFKNHRVRAYPNWVRLIDIMTNSFTLPNDPSIIREAVRLSVAGRAQFFAQQAVPVLGVEAAQMCVFHTETLGRAYRLLFDLRGDAGQGTAGSEPNVGAKFLQAFSPSALFAQLHLACLGMIVEKKLGVPAEVLEEIFCGSRYALAAYACVRDESETGRKQMELVPVQPASLDEEDRSLLVESFSEYADREPDLDDQG